MEARMRRPGRIGGMRLVEIGLDGAGGITQHRQSEKYTCHGQHRPILLFLIALTHYAITGTSSFNSFAALRQKIFSRSSLVTRRLSTSLIARGFSEVSGGASLP